MAYRNTMRLECYGRYFGTVTLRPEYLRSTLGYGLALAYLLCPEPTVCAGMACALAIWHKARLRPLTRRSRKD